MSDETTDQVATVTAPVIEDDKPKTVPYERFSEVVAQRKVAAEDAKEAREELATINADREKVRKAGLEKQGEFKTLLEESKAENESLKTRAETAEDKWDKYETSRREALTAELNDEDKALAMKMTDLTDMEAFIKRIAGNNSTSTDTRRVVNNLPDGKLKPIADMSDKEQRDSHEARLASYK